MEESSLVSAEYLPNITHNLGQKKQSKANGVPKIAKFLKKPEL